MASLRSALSWSLRVIDLAGGPAHSAATENVDVEVMDALTAIRAGVSDEPEAVAVAGFDGQARAGQQQ